MNVLRLFQRNVHVLHPIQVLLVSRDRRYLRVASFLLGRAGLEVLRCENPAVVADAVGRGRPSVVVIDLDSLQPGAASVVADVQARRPSVGVVVVAEPPPIGMHNVFAALKWGGLESLLAQIERAYMGVPAGDGDRGGGVTQR